MKSLLRSAESNNCRIHEQLSVSPSSYVLLTNPLYRPITSLSLLHDLSYLAGLPFLRTP